MRTKKPAPIRRPYATHYYRHATDRAADLVTQGAAKSPEGAIRATVVRVFLEQHEKAVIHDRRTGLAIYTVVRTGAGIRVHYGRR